MILTDIKTNQKLVGIYKIINKTNGKYYVGSSNHVHRRKRRHRNELRMGLHANNHLQSSWNKYGETNFEFVLVEEVLDEFQLLNIEQHYLDIAKSEKDICYNASFSADRTWLSDETKFKISKTMTGRKTSEQMKQKCRMNMLGQNNHRYGKPQNTTIHTFQNRKTEEVFTGTQYELTIKYGLRNGSMSQIANGNRKSLWGWMLLKDAP